MRRFAWLVAGVLALGFIAGCNTTSTTGSTPDFSLLLSQSSINIDTGTSGSVSITVTPSGGFSGMVSLSVSGAPAGVTTNLNPNATAASSTLQVTVAGTATPGSYALTIRGTSGSLTHDATLTLTVSSPAPPPATTGSVTGTVSMLAGVPGDLNNAQCGLYTGLTEWANYSPAYTATVIGSGATVSFAFPTVVPGSYYLDCWLDIDLNGFWSSGDLVAIYGTFVGGVPTLTPLPPVIAGGVVTVSLTASYLP